MTYLNFWDPRVLGSKVIVNYISSQIARNQMGNCKLSAVICSYLCETSTDLNEKYTIRKMKVSRLHLLF